MIKEAMEYLFRTIAQAEKDKKPFFEIDGRKYGSQTEKPLREPKQDILTFETLSGLVDYIKAGNDFEGDAIIHVVNAERVLLMSHPWGAFEQRTYFAEASYDYSGFSFGRWYTIEEFVIQIMSHFKMEKNVESMLTILSNIVDKKVKQVEDDGITQQVTVRKGLTTVAAKPIPRTMELAPYRTFHDVEPVMTPFVLRLKNKGEDEEIICALFDTGDIWKHLYIRKIRDWLREQLGDKIEIYA